MRMLVLGAGLQGSACAYDLLQNGVDSVVLADQQTDAARLPRGYRDARLRGALDARATPTPCARRHAGRGRVHERAAVLLQPRHHTLAVETACTTATSAATPPSSSSSSKLDDAAAAAGVSVIPDCGLAPAWSTSWPRRHRRAGRADSVGSASAGCRSTRAAAQLPDRLLAGRRARLLHDAVLGPARRRAGAGGRALRDRAGRVPEPVGTLEAFHTAGGLSTMPWT
jgi:lysine 6-dehydrogenase